MEKGITFVGLDVHKGSINVAMHLPGESRAVEWQTSNDPAAVRRLVRKLQCSGVGEVRLCYEAGPCGYAVQRAVQGMGVSCIVVAPSLIPSKPGDRVKDGSPGRPQARGAAARRSSDRGSPAHRGG